MKLIADWKQSHKFYVVWISLALLAFDVLHMALPLLQESVSPAWFAVINAAAVGLIPIVRIIKQAGLGPAQEGDQDAT